MQIDYLHEIKKPTKIEKDKYEYPPRAPKCLFTDRYSIWYRSFWIMKIKASYGVAFSVAPIFFLSLFRMDNLLHLIILI